MWSAYRDRNGYGHFRLGSKVVLAHRFSYERTRGPIPEGKVIDHLCRTPACVNPVHMEVVTPRVNTLRGDGISSINSRKTSCRRGHQFTAENTRVEKDGARVCRRCDAIRAAAYEARKKGKQR